jgi:hypothetical protein
LITMMADLQARVSLSEAVHDSRSTAAPLVDLQPPDPPRFSRPLDRVVAAPSPGAARRPRRRPR